MRSTHRVSVLEEANLTNNTSQILSYLHMVSLLQLARTTKDLRRFLFSRERSRSLIWRPAFKRQYPDADEFDEEWERYWKDLSEPQLASLIFEAMCQVCQCGISNRPY